MLIAQTNSGEISSLEDDADYKPLGKGEIFCRYCKKSAFFRDGDKYIPHFAHHVKNKECPYSFDDAKLLPYRKILKDIFDKLNLDYEMEYFTEGQSRLVDFIQNTSEGKTAYILAYRGIREWDNLKTGLQQLGIINLRLILIEEFLNYSTCDKPDYLKLSFTSQKLKKTLITLEDVFIIDKNTLKVCPYNYNFIYDHYYSIPLDNLKATSSGNLNFRDNSFRILKMDFVDSIPYRTEEQDLEILRSKNGPKPKIPKPKSDNELFDFFKD